MKCILNSRAQTLFNYAVLFSLIIRYIYSFHLPFTPKLVKRKVALKSRKINEERVKLEPEFLERAKRQIVLIDDEESIRLAVGDYLYDNGYQVTACADADAFLVEFSNFEKEVLPIIPDVIISDIRMPGKDGLELLNLIRSHERLKRVPVVLLTAKSLTKDRIDGYKAGANVYLPKPFNPEELLAIVDNLIMRRSQMLSDSGQYLDLKEEMSDIKFLLKEKQVQRQKDIEQTSIELTPVEQEVLELLSKGLTNGEIAVERGVSVAWVSRTIMNLYSKTFTKTRTELVKWAIKTGQISRQQL